MSGILSLLRRTDTGGKADINYLLQHMTAMRLANNKCRHSHKQNI